MEERVGDRYFYQKDGDKIGPVAFSQMLKLLEEGLISGQTPVWRMGLPTWIRLLELKEFTQISQNSRADSPPLCPFPPDGHLYPNIQDTAVSGNHIPDTKTLSLGSLFLMLAHFLHRFLGISKLLNTLLIRGENSQRMGKGPDEAPVIVSGTSVHWIESAECLVRQHGRALFNKKFFGVVLAVICSVYIVGKSSGPFLDVEFVWFTNALTGTTIRIISNEDEPMEVLSVVINGECIADPYFPGKQYPITLTTGSEMVLHLGSYAAEPETICLKTSKGDFNSKVNWRFNWWYFWN